MVKFTRVAIIGAGLAGLSCAHELKSNGIIPTIFEKKDMTGEILDYQSILLNIFVYPGYGDPIKYLKKNYNLSLLPQFKIKKSIFVAPDQKVYSTKGKLGYVMKRGTVSDSIENQIAHAINLPIQFDTYIDIKDIIGKFDYIVVATGTPVIAKEFNIFTTTFSGFVRISTVLGNFKTDSIKMWFGTKFSKNAYAYFVPYSPKAARITLIVNGITHAELDYYWNLFLETEEITYKITEVRDREHDVGFVDPVQVGNVYFVGNAGGFIDDLFGFGSAKAEMSGVTAARAIINNKNYDKMMQPMKDDITSRHEFRTALNSMSDKDLDRTLAFLDLPVIKQLVYNNPLFNVTHATFLAKVLNYVWRKTKKPL